MVLSVARMGFYHSRPIDRSDFASKLIPYISKDVFGRSFFETPSLISPMSNLHPLLYEALSSHCLGSRYNFTLSIKFSPRAHWLSFVNKSTDSHMALLESSLENLGKLVTIQRCWFLNVQKETDVFMGLGKRYVQIHDQ